MSAVARFVAVVVAVTTLAAVPLVLAHPDDVVPVTPGSTRGQ